MSASELFGLGDRAVARRSDPETSHEAAESVKGITDQQELILDLFRRMGPMIDEKAFQWFNSPWGISPSGFRSRRKELCDMGKLEWSGGWGETRSGRKARIWRVTCNA